MSTQHDVIKSEMTAILSQDDEISINPAKVKRKSANNDKMLIRLNEDEREGKDVITLRLNKSYADKLKSYQLKLSNKRGQVVSLSKVAAMILISFLDEEG